MLFEDSGKARRLRLLVYRVSAGAGRILNASDVRSTAGGLEAFYLMDLERVKAW